MLLRVWRRVHRELSWLEARRCGVECDRSVHFCGSPIIERSEGGSVRIGHHAALVSVSSRTALGVSHPVILRLLRPGAEIRIGAHSGLSGTAVCSAVSVIIGDECLIGSDVIIADTDFHALAPGNRRHEQTYDKIAASPVRIGNNVFIGARAMVLKGVSIGDDSVIGAGSVVVKDIPAGVVAAGNPCRVIRSLPT